MKYHILHLLKVIFISFLVCVPGIIIFSIIWQQHIKLLATNDLLCSNTNFLEQVFTCYKYAQTLNKLVLIVGLILLFLGILVFSIDGYLAYRITERKKTIEKLERIYNNHY